MTCQSSQSTILKNRYIVTETKKYVSLDPLDGDSTVNLPVFDMIYAKPIEVGQDEQLYSLVLKSFRYDIEHRIVELVVKNNIFFSDGSLITTEDVAFSILRMALTRPKFPMIRDIVGLQSWAESSNPLEIYPQGISIENRRIRIKFSKEVRRPLSRLALQLFSIIPKRCVDLRRNTLVCDEIPTSGLYTIEDEGSSYISFVKRWSALPGLAENIVFEYSNLSQASEVSSGSNLRKVIATNESIVWPRSFAYFYEKGFHLTLRPKSRFDLLYLNPDKEIFASNDNRSVFKKVFYEKLSEVGLDDDIEGSIFTSIMPGYLPLKDLAKGLDKEKVNFVKADKVIYWSSRLPENSPGLKAVKLTLDEFGLKGVRDDRNFDLQLGSTGFWPIDPMGDLQMLFTPGLHKSLEAIARDPMMQKKIEDLQDLDGETLDEEAKKFSRYMFDKGIFNVYKYNQRLYLTNFEPRVSLVTVATSPWQFFVTNDE
ncbi:ABC-type transport system, substrate-binding protein [Pseudobacteriovorax antillogorgiicola]|uniref:ABC-type transport system, substrate-binding protein n=2 Tax=Pseudobacteriovorax antillogorgiicola TaxID=1513793 RepID=A0A1Y6CR60_9BACT|nr:ABC-type transport system substrate-binding protein [Pseudobacteriovorax antillogorgiicola]SMF84549.1 ABC-type transport system, substrate-binding protein [Pseudobacteriovorax antillogorgiicola]